MENDFNDTPVQLHFDMSYPPPHLQVNDRPSQDITLMAALSGAAAVENQAEQFHHQGRKTRNLDDMACIFDQRDTLSALKLLGQWNEHCMQATITFDKRL